MPPTVPTDIPDQLTAGDTWRWDVAFADYPASEGWTLAYHLRGVGTLDVTATADGDDFAVTVDAEATAALPEGLYQFLARASLAGAVYTVDSGTVTVLADAATATPGALQTHAEKMLAAYKAEIQARVTGAGTAHESHGILGRNIQFVSLEELEAQRRRYEMEVAMQRRGGQLPPVVIRFGGTHGP